MYVYVCIITTVNSNSGSRSIISTTTQPSLSVALAALKVNKSFNLSTASSTMFQSLCRRRVWYCRKVCILSQLLSLLLPLNNKDQP